MQKVLFIVFIGIFLTPIYCWACAYELAGEGEPHLHRVDFTYDRPSSPASVDAILEWRALLEDGVPIEESVNGLAKLVNSLLEGGSYPGHQLYRRGILLIASQVNVLRTRIYVHLPGGLTGNSDPFWDEVRAVTRSACACGNERELAPPISIAEKWIAPEPATEVVIQAGEVYFVKPAGLDDSFALARLELGRGDNGKFFIRISQNPGGPMNLQAFKDMFAPNVFLLSQFDSLATEPLILVNTGGASRPKMAYLKLVATDPVKGTFTIIPAQGVEVFKPTDDQNAYMGKASEPRSPSWLFWFRR